MPRLQAVISTVFVLSVSVIGAARAGPADDASFKDWTVVCDNLRNCEADGFSAEDAEKPAVLELTRGGAPEAAPGVTIWLLLDDASEAARGKPLMLVVDGRPVLTARADDRAAVKLADAQVERLLGAARNGSQLSLRLGDDELGVVSLAGMVAALRLVDDQQERVGTVTAMVAKGAAPRSTVPPQPVMPVVRRAPAVAQTGLPKKSPTGVKALRAKAGCDTGQDSVFDSEPEAQRLSADQVLWRVPCGSGAYNFTSLFVIVGNKGEARIAPLEGVDDGLVDGGAYDSQTRMLRAYNKGRGVGDCGHSSEWTWTGRDFLLTKMTSMPVCRGQSAWPTSFQAKVE